MSALTGGVWSSTNCTITQIANGLQVTVPQVWSGAIFYDNPVLWDFTATPILEFDILVDNVPPALLVGFIDRTAGSWNWGGEDIVSQLLAGQSVHVTVDLSKAGLPLNAIARVQMEIQAQSWFAVNATITNIQLTNGTVPSNMTVVISPMSGSVSTNQTLTLTATAAGGVGPYTYYWWENSITVSTGASYAFNKSVAGTYIIACGVIDSTGYEAMSAEAIITVNSPGATTIFDPCDSLTPSNGAWGTTGAGGAVGGVLSVQTDSPPQGTGYIRNTIPNNIYASWLHKRTDGVWDFSVNPVLGFRLRGSAPFHAEFIIVTATGASLWESASKLMPTALVAGQWVTEPVDLRTMVNGTTGLPSDLTLVRSIEVYVENLNQAMTLDIDDLEVSGGPVVVTRVLTIGSASGGSTSPAAGSYPETDGSIVSVTATPSSGYSFTIWTLDGVNAGNANPIVVTMSADHTLTPVFTVIPPVTRTLTISSSPSNGGTTSPVAGAYSEPDGALVTITAAPNVGFALDHWVVDGVIVSDTTFTLTISAATGGTTSSTPQPPYLQGQVVQVTAQPSSGYVFSNWLLDGANAGSANPISITMNADHTLTPVFSVVTPPAQGALHVSGNLILDSNNATVYLRGLGLGGMLPQLIVWGPGSTNNSYPWAPSTDILDATFQCFRDVWHVNMIRIFVIPEFYWRDIVSVAGQFPIPVSTRNYIKTVCAEAAKYGIYVDLVPYTLLSFTEAFAAGPYLSVDRFQGLPGLGWNADAVRFFSDMGFANNEMGFWNAFWTQMANDLKSYPNVIFEAWNEPQDSNADNTPVPAGYKTYLSTMYNAIRATGATNLIFMQWRLGWYPNGWGNNLDWAGVINTTLGGNPSNVVYTTHWYYYAPSDNSSYWTLNANTIRTAIQNAVAGMGVNAPLVVNEAGSTLYYSPNVNNDYSWWNSICTIAKSLGIGLTLYYWAGAATEGGTGWANESILLNGGAWPSGAASPSPNPMGQNFINAYGGP